MFMKAMILVLLFGFAAAIPERDPMDNPGLFEGDILGLSSEWDRNAVPKDSQRWPDGIVPYVLDSSLSSVWNRIKRGMDHIEQRTCIKFVQQQDERDYLRIFKGSGCYSHWGRIGGRQSLSLGSGCYDLGTVVHELLHALGFHHEHNRSDRDSYLKIFWENIQESKQYNFHKLLPKQNRLLTEFDYNSVMLYGSTAFAKQRGLKTMVKKDGKDLQEVYNKPGLSTKDVTRVKMLYNC